MSIEIDCDTCEHMKKTVHEYPCRDCYSHNNYEARKEPDIEPVLKELRVITGLLQQIVVNLNTNKDRG